MVAPAPVLLLVCCGDRDGADSAAPEPDTGIVEFDFEGSVQVVAGSSWHGVETATWRTPGGDVLCAYDSEVSSTSPATGCDDCLVAFDVLVAPGADTMQGEWCDAWGVEPPNTYAAGYGYGPELEADTATGDGVLLFRDSREWQAVAAATWDVADGSGTLTYTWVVASWRVYW